MGDRFHEGRGTPVCLSPARAPMPRHTAACTRIRLRIRSCRFLAYGGAMGEHLVVRGNNVPRDPRRDGHPLRIRARFKSDAVWGRISAAPRRKRGEPQKDPLSNVSIIVG
jgi:hypothetical protein